MSLSRMSLGMRFRIHSATVWLIAAFFVVTAQSCLAGNPQAVRQPGVAGSFYPADPKALTAMIDELLALLGGRGKLVMAHLVEAGEITLADVKEAEKALRKPLKKDAPR